MTKRYFLTAAAGCWITSIPSSDDIKREFYASIETNDDSLFEEVTDEWKTEYEQDWEERHSSEFNDGEESSDVSGV